MFFLVLALFLLGVLTGTAAHVPLPVTLVSTAAILAWLAAFAVRERSRAHRRDR
ncbi:MULTISPECIES: hypothetical protein [Streptomyces]|uniref:hypothetical protein n=1 Tax=Streptomyces TaxID=1883 RepID=UPI00163B8C48|nr:MULTISPECIES: hypothetical protein [Streptomyces]MBC2876578.1 hypothetical protein [Streptomyces sp. TYQ1024]UBI40752.1 hypothetical protein K7I03_32665 [Streptomyces mobaraensis]UKW33332.1 hypothetical protein MCU78_32590 [Streptomyces sp. TYQ1024]